MQRSAVQSRKKAAKQQKSGSKGHHARIERFCTAEVVETKHFHRLPGPFQQGVVDVEAAWHWRRQREVAGG